MKFHLIDSNAALCGLWKSNIKSLTHSCEGIQGFSLPRVHIHNCPIASLFEHHSVEGPSAVVTPTNSLAYMGGGFDKYLLQAILAGTDVTDYRVLERVIQDQTLLEHRSFLPVGNIRLTDLKLTLQSDFEYEKTVVHKNWQLQWLIQLPTMIVPSDTPSKDSVFGSMWKILHECNTSQPLSSVRNIIIPGIGTGYGSMDFEDVANIMIGSIFIYTLDLPSEPKRQNGLIRSLLVLFLLKKDYRKFADEINVAEMDSLVSDFGRDLISRPSFSTDSALSVDHLLKCIKI